jgi:hypothetical protein
VRLFVAGGTGVVGRPLVETLVDRGHEVTASTHRTENFAVIEALGARPALMDGLDDAAVRQAILETEPAVIINQITALSAPSRNYARWLAVTNRLRSQGTNDPDDGGSRSRHRLGCCPERQLHDPAGRIGPDRRVVTPVPGSPGADPEPHTGEHRRRTTGVGHTGDRRRRPSIRVSLR